MAVGGPALLLLAARGLEDQAAEVFLESLESAQQLPFTEAHWHSNQCSELPEGCPRLRRAESLRFERHARACPASVPSPPVPCLLPSLRGRIAPLESASQGSTPQVEEGEAFVGKLLLRLEGLSAAQRRAVLSAALRSGLFQGVFSFLTAAEPIDSSGRRQGRGTETNFLGSLAQVEAAVASADAWPAARALHREAAELSGLPVRALTKFRASCVRDGQLHKGFRSQDVMAAIGAGALAANPDLEIDLYDYELEVFGFLAGSSFACGLWLGPEWRVTSQGTVQGGAERNFHVVPVGDRRLHLPYDVRNLPRLRPSTALLLLSLARPGRGETLLDPFGGVGTIAIEAACQFEGLTGISSDKDPTAAHTAAAHSRLAVASGALQPGGNDIFYDDDAFAFMRRRLF
eukprot:s1841_g2.t1